MKGLVLDMKENNILSDINKLLADNISQDEREILSHAKKELEKKSSFSRIISDLRGELTPLAVSQKLSKSVGTLYLKINSHEFQSKNFGGGLIMGWGQTF